MSEPAAVRKPATERRGFRIWKPRRLASGFLICLLLSSCSFAFSFVVFGDPQGSDKIFGDLISKVNAEEGISFAVNNGDLVVYGKESEYKHYLQMIAKLKVPVHNVMGNHDAVAGGWKLFEKYFGAPYYSFDFEGSHFIILNNAFKASFDRQQFEWLKNDLSSSPARHKFVFMHRPAFDPSEIYKDYVMSGREITQELMVLFTKYKVDYVFAGHIHGYARAERDGVTYIVTAGAGAPLYFPPGFGGFYHYVKIDVDNDKITDRVVKLYE